MNLNLKKTRAVCWVVVLLGLATVGSPSLTAAMESSRFFFDGDGRISLVSEKNGSSFSGRYRLGPGNYDPAAMRSICRVFDAPCTPPGRSLSLRLIAYLDWLEDRLEPGARITITSGYRSPEYNTRLRNRGGLVAKASLHQYGMAADLKLGSVPAKRLWQYAKAAGFGGAGYYQGDSVHLDVGPTRAWDARTAGVNTGISEDNKLIGLVTDYDVYRPTEEVTMDFIRMTAFPVGVSPEFTLLREETQDEVAVFKPTFAAPADGACPQFSTIDQMAAIRWRLPQNLPPGRFFIRARFCGNPWEAMPSAVSTAEFEIRAP